MSTYAQLEDVEEAWGRPIPVEMAPEFQRLLDEAEIELASVVGDLAERVTAGLTTAERLRSAVVGMVVTASRGDGPSLCLVVGRRERWLAGVRSTGQSISLSHADPSLAAPIVPAPPRNLWLSQWR